MPLEVLFCCDEPSCYLWKQEDSDRGGLWEQPWPGRVLRHRRPVASSIYTKDPAALRADTRYVSPAVREPRGKWPVGLSEETNTLFTLPFISINSVQVFDASEVNVFV